MSEEIAIKVDNVSKDFRLVHEKNATLKSKFTSLIKGKGSGRSATKQHALKDISFEVKKGDFFGIVGRNGSGKSTMLKILAEIYQPTNGSIHVTGRLVPFIELGVGFNPELTGRENVYLNGAIIGFSKKEIDGFYDSVVDFAELEQYMDKKLKNYSSGMQVRLAFSMAIRANADILLIDEVLAVGDADFQRKCFEYFKQLKKHKKTVVFVSHDMAAIRQFCDYAILIEAGCIQEKGPVNSVAGAYSKLFLNDSDSFTEEKSVKRWGEFKNTFKNPKVLLKNDRIFIKNEIETRTAIHNPIVGFVVKDASGEPILGANNRMLEFDTGDLKLGQKKVYVWSIDNILTDGKYSIDLAIVREDGVGIIEWWEDAKQFRVKRVLTSPYNVQPSIILKEEEK